MPFWPFVRRIRVGSLSPEELQSRLVDAAYSSRSYLRRFCQAYRQQIESNVESLTKMPEALRNNPAAINRMIQGLGAVSQCLANECGSAALWQTLTGTADDNPLLRWPKFLDELPDRMQRLEHEALEAELVGLIEETKQFGGGSACQHEAFVVGELEKFDSIQDALLRLLNQCRRHSRFAVRFTTARVSPSTSTI